jgi:isopentenyl-diphosphate delta-isomerase
MDKVILVNRKGEKIGLEEKLKAHQIGKLHSAFSIFIFNSEGHLMLQRRAKSKYHAGGLWTNTCCSHPRDGETFEIAAHRRLKEEMGFDCELEKRGHIVYKAPVGNLIEHEYDVLFVGNYGDEPKINLEEADDWKWVDFGSLLEDVVRSPQVYTPWLKVILNKFDSVLPPSALTLQKPMLTI